MLALRPRAAAGTVRMHHRSPGAETDRVTSGILDVYPHQRGGHGQVGDGVLGQRERLGELTICPRDNAVSSMAVIELLVVVSE